MQKNKINTGRYSRAPNAQYRALQETKKACDIIAPLILYMLICIIKSFFNTLEQAQLRYRSTEETVVEL